MKDEKKVISVAQLSMVDASQQVEYKTSKTIINPLNTLVSYIVNQLELEKKISYKLIFPSAKGRFN